MKKKCNSLIVLLFMVVLTVSALHVKEVNSIHIDGDEVPYGAGYVEQGDEDINIIPDKYNTGCDEASLTTKVEGEQVINDIQICKYGDSLAIRFQDSFKDNIEFNNIDFSPKDFVVANDQFKTKNCTMTFNNCKFSTFRVTNIYDSKVNYVFNNCSFVHYDGSNAQLNNCYFGSGSAGDGVNPYRNCTFTNCMIADLVHSSDKAGETNHIDGIQFFGEPRYGKENMNIHFKNCRIEVPQIPYTYSKGLLNCPITFTMNFSDAKDISFEDIYVNGGQYFSIMVYKDKHNISDVVFKNVKVGGARSKDNIVGDNPIQAKFEDTGSTDSLYVASVWKSGKKIHLSVTNDTNQERQLMIVTSNGSKKFDIKKCPTTPEIATDSMDYEDFPFDIDVKVDDADWVVCYDITDGQNKQIRFVNWSNDKVPELDFGKSNMTTSGNNAITGECGKNVKYTISDGVLSLQGEGATYDYSLSNPAPWADYVDQITQIKVGKGITNIGSQLFAKCKKVKNIQIADGVEDIASNAFVKTSNLNDIELPVSVKNIDKYAFWDSNLSKVNYAGSKKQWQSITIEACNDVIKNAEIVYDYKLSSTSEEVADADAWVDDNIELGSAELSGKCGKSVSWQIDKNGLLYISGTGSMENYNSAKVAPWMSYGDKITGVKIDSGVTSIGMRSFAGLSKLKKVSIDDSVTSIAGNAFMNCKELTEMHMGKGITSIGSYAFSGTGKLTVYYAGTSETWQRIKIAENNLGVLTCKLITK